MIYIHSLKLWSLSFVFSSILNTGAHSLFARWIKTIARFERATRLPEDAFTQPEGATILVIGMGRVGAGAYDFFQDNLEQKVYGVDLDVNRVAKQCLQGRNAIAADAEDPEFWSLIDLERIQLITLAMPNYLDILEVMNQLRRNGYKGKTSCIATYEDQEAELLDAGVDVVYNFYQNAGAGFAENSSHLTNGD